MTFLFEDGSVVVATHLRKKYLYPLTIDFQTVKILDISLFRGGRFHLVRI